MTWKKTKDELPPEGKYVLARHNRGTWIDNQDPENVNCVVVKLVKGLSHEDRMKMKKGEIPLITEMSVSWNGAGHDRTQTPRYDIYKSEDEHGNNLKPYYWDTFGPDKFFGQAIDEWCEIPESEKIPDLIMFIGTNTMKRLDKVEARKQMVRFILLDGKFVPVDDRHEGRKVSEFKYLINIDAWMSL